MMTLQDVGDYFATTEFFDAYDPATMFLGRLMPFLDVTRDSLTTDRRILALASDATIPPRRTIKVGDHVFLVGNPSPDFHGNEVLREKYTLHQAYELADICTFEAALAGQVTQQLWGGRLFIKPTKEIDESSGIYEGYTCYFSSTEDLRHPDWNDGTFFDGREDYVLIRIAGHWHLVRTVYDTGAGLQACVVDELPEPVLPDVVYTQRIYRPVTDDYTESSSTIKAVNLRWQSNFQYLSRYSAKYENGDCVLKVLKADIANAKAGDLVDLRGRKYKVVAIQDEGAVWHLHIRYA